MTEKRKVAATIDMVWSLEKQKHIPTIGMGDIELNVTRIHPRLFTEGVLVLVDSGKGSKAESKQQKPPEKSAKSPKED